MDAREKNTFLTKIRKFLVRENIPGPEKKALLAISGGLDSVVLWHILDSLGYGLELAHVNFGLRGQDSDEDEAFVKNLARENGLILHIKRVETGEWNKKSIQERAREIRYQWFENLATEKGMETVFLAHHADDQAETILLNLFRGTGISGLKGMVPKNGLWTRPLLECSKSSLLAYARLHGLAWREDASNQKADYTRNAIRLKLLPAIQSRFPGVEKVLRKEALRFRLAENVLAQTFEALENVFFSKTCLDGKAYNFEAICRHAQGDFFLLEKLKRLGFPADVFENLVEEPLKNESRIWKSTQNNLLELKGQMLWFWENENLLINQLFSGPGPKEHPFEKCNWINFHPNEKNAYQIQFPGFKSFLNRELTFPITLKNWEPGDKISIHGIRKKVSDVLTDLKLSKMQKNRVFKLESAQGEVLDLLIPV